MEILSSGINILVILIGFGLLIFVHELGHFLAAKWAGIRTEGFSIGFGPPICSWRKGVGFRLGSTYGEVRRRTGRLPRELSDDELSEAGLGETEYALRWLPLGGFVKMLGQDDMDPAANSSHQRSFNMRPISRRMVVISAGVVMNMLFAGVLFVIAFSIGVRFESPIIGEVSPGSPAATAVPINGTELGVDTVGLQPGDRVLEVDGKSTTTFGDLQIATAMGRPDVHLTLQVQRDGISDPLAFEITPRKDESIGLMGIGIQPASSTRLVTAKEVSIVEPFLKQRGLQEQGIEPGMTLSTIDGEPVWNYETYKNFARNSAGTPLKTTWVAADDNGRGTGTTIHATLDPVPQWEQLRYPGATGNMLVGYEDGLIGLVPLVRIANVSPGSPNHDVLQVGDVVLRIGHQQAPRMREFRRTIQEHGAGTISMAVLRDDQRIELDARIEDTGVLNPKPMLGIAPSYAWETTYIAQPMTRVEEPDGASGTFDTQATPVASLGLLGGSRILSVNQVAVADWSDVWRELHAAAVSGASSVDLQVTQPTPGREQRHVVVALDEAWRTRVADLQWNPSISYYFFEPLYILKHANGNPLKAMSMGMQETVSFVLLTYLTIDRLFRGTVGVEQLQGPVGIVHLGSKIADRGFSYLLFFLGLISVNLAVINFLPLPIVDGGLFLYLVYEKFKGRPPSVGFQNSAAIVGLLLIATAFVVTFYNDIARLVG